MRLARQRRPQRLVVGADHQVGERSPLVLAHQQVGGPLEVPLDFLLDGALEACLRPAALGVLVLDVGVDVVDLPQAGRPATQDAGRLPGHEQHAPVALILQADHRLEQRPLVDRDRGIDGVRQLDRDEGVKRVRRVHGQRTRAFDVGIVAQKGLDALAVGLERLARVARDALVVDQGVELGEQRVDLALARRRGGERARVQVEEEADDDRLVGLHLRERLQGLVRELVRWHAGGATRSPRRGPPAWSSKRPSRRELSRGDDASTADPIPGAGPSRAGRGGPRRGPRTGRACSGAAS